MNTVNQIDQRHLLQSPTTKKNYIVINELGRGAFGRVFLAAREEDNLNVAIKVIVNSKQNDPQVYQTFKNEVEILQAFNSSNIVRIYDSWEDEHSGFMVMEYCNSGDLGEYIMKQGPFAEDQALQMIQQIMNGLSVMQNSPEQIVHRDLKPDNILIHNNQLKLADLGCSKKIQDNKQLLETSVGTPVYMAPEIIMCEQYTFECDLYSLGCILYQILYGKVPYIANSVFALVKNLEKDCPPDFEYNNIHISDQLQDLITQMLRFKASDRIKFKDLFQHSIFIASPFNDQYLENVQNIGSNSNLEGGSMLEQSKLNFSNIKSGIMKGNFKDFKKGVFGMASLVKNKVQSTINKENFDKIINKCKNIKDQEQEVIETIKKYLDLMNNFNIIGKAIEQPNIEPLKYQQDSLLNIKICHLLMYKKIFKLYDDLKRNMVDPNFHLNQVQSQEKLFSFFYFKNLQQMVEKARLDCYQKIQGLQNELSSQNVPQPVRKELQGFEFDQILYKQYIGIYFRLFKGVVENLRKPGEGVKSNIQNQRNLYYIAVSGNYEYMFQELGYSNEKFKEENSKFSENERALKINELEQRI